MKLDCSKKKKKERELKSRWVVYRGAGVVPVINQPTIKDNSLCFCRSFLYGVQHVFKI
jgi:hypothetical protein